MKPSHWLALASAVTACAVACGIHIIGKHGASNPVAAGSARLDSTTGARDHASFSPTAASRASRVMRPESRSSGASVREPAGIPDRRVLVPSVSVGGSVLSESVWRERAAKVETEANHELDRLVGLLDLDGVQQNQVFSALARQSPHWLPGMQAGGILRPEDSTLAGGKIAEISKMNPGRQIRSTGPAATDVGLLSPDGSSQSTAVDLTAYLTSEQQQSLVEEEMDRQAWWAEILPQILAPTIPDGDDWLDSFPGNDDSTDPAPETKEFGGGGMLLEE